MDNSIPKPEENNPLLARIKFPGETFTLPSGGLFYPPESGILDPSAENAEVHVHPMTAIDEIVMKTPDLLFSGKAAEQVFSRCIPQVTNIYGLLTKDVDFLLACLRKVSYGDVMNVDYQHDCENAKEHSYQLDVSGFVREAKKIDPTTLNSNFVVDFPNGQQAHVQPVTFGGFINTMQILNTSKDDETPEEIKTAMIESIAGIIVDVDGIIDKMLIAEWLSNVPAGYIDMINKVTEKNLGWGTDFKSTVTCFDCGKKMEISASINPLAFFT